MKANNWKVFGLQMSHDLRRVTFSFIYESYSLSYFVFVFCYSPSGEKKVLEPKSSADMNGYQIRV